MFKKSLFVGLLYFFALVNGICQGNLFIPGFGLPGFDSTGHILFGEIPFDTVVHNTSSENGRIAMFLLPLNYTVHGQWEQFELKASTNNFSHLVPEDVRLQYYAQSEIADTGADKDGVVYDTTLDKMLLYDTGTAEDVRAYRYVGNTMPVAGHTNHIMTAVVLVDTGCLKRHPEGVRWLDEGNKDLCWVWHRYYYRGDVTVRETNEFGRVYWRPVAPVRWFSEFPNWSGR